MRALPWSLTAAIVVATWICPARADSVLTPDSAGIRRVTVYADRAQVERTGRVTLPAGRSQVTVSGLPAPLLGGTVRASVADDRARVIGLTMREEVHLRQRRAELADLHQQMRQVREAIRALQTEDGTLQNRLQQLQLLRKYTGGVAALQQTDPGVDVAELDRTMDLIRDDGDALISRRSALRALLNERMKELSRIQQRMNDLQYGSERTSTTLTVTVEASSAVTSELLVSYGVGGVSWSPRYDVRYDDETLTLAYLAEVRQASGEDWEEVQMVFTTARPDEMVPPPAAEALYLRGYKEKETTVQLGSKLEEASQEKEAMGGEPPVDTRDGGVTIVSRSLAVDLVVGHPATVPADGRPYRIAVLEQDLDAQVDRYAAPSLSPHLFLRARTSNSTGVPLLPGPVDVFRSSGYVGTITLDYLAPGEPLALSLGPAGPVTVTHRFDEERNHHVDHTPPGRKKVHFVYDVVIDNFGDDPADVVIAEAVPVSRVDQVRVHLSDETSAGYDVSEDGSIHTWSVSLAAGEKKTLHLAYVVDLPEDYAWEGF